jgi:hypothetical protein
MAKGARGRGGPWPTQKAATEVTAAKPAGRGGRRPRRVPNILFEGDDSIKSVMKRMKMRREACTTLNLVRLSP